MGKFSKSKIFLERPEDGAEGHLVRGLAHKGLAIVRRKTGVWSLMHMRTGASLISMEGDRSGVHEISEAIAALEDWENFESREAIMALPGMKDRIQAVILACLADTEGGYSS